MKIAYLSQSMIPSEKANAVQVMKMCQAFSQNGHEVTLYACKGKRKAGENVFSRYGIEESFSIVSWSIPDIPGRFLILALLTFLHISLCKKVDLLYARGLFSLFLCSRLPIPFFYEVHAPPRTFIHQWLENHVLKHKKLNKLIAITQSLKQFYIKQYPHLASKAITAPDGADNDQHTARPGFVFPQQLKRKEVSFRIGYCGSLHSGKGVEFILNIASQLLDVHFHIAGGTKEQVDRMINKQKPGDNIFFYGHIDHKEVPGFLSSMSVVVAPYQKIVMPTGNRNIAPWMSPLKLFEYMAAGKPIICSDMPVIREVLQDHTNCLLCDPENIEAWVTAIKTLRSDKALANQLATQAKADLLAHYTWTSRARKIISG